MQDVIVAQEGRAGRLTLNRPKALNALTAPMVAAITAALQAWQHNPAVELVILDGAGEKGLCAGGDVRWLYDVRNEPGVAAAFWAEEYRLNAMIARYPKPYVAFMDGIVMGGGIGLSAHGRHRIVTERSMLAMPETTIGLIPDVGGTWLLARAQGRLGVYLGLTGARMSGSDAIQAGFADTYLTAAAIPDLIQRLVAVGGDPVEDLIEQAGEPIPASPLAAKRELIDRLFAGATLPEIQRTLLTTTDDLATKARGDLSTRSPKALVLTLAAIQRAKRYARLDDALKVEYRLCTRLYDDGEFVEGVRALLVDKDRAPKWRPSRVDDVSAELVESYFAPLPRDWSI